MCVFIANSYVVWSIAEQVFIIPKNNSHILVCRGSVRDANNGQTTTLSETEKKEPNAMDWVSKWDSESEAYWTQANFAQKPDAYHNLNVGIELCPSISHSLTCFSHSVCIRHALFRGQNTGNIINEIKFNLTWKCKHKFFNRIILMDVDK